MRDKFIGYCSKEQSLIKINPENETILVKYELLRQFPSGLLFAHPDNPEELYWVEERLNGNEKQLFVREPVFARVAKTEIPADKDPVFLRIPEGDMQ